MNADSSPNDDDQALFEWFDGLGFKDFSKLQLVKITTGWWSQSGNEKPKNKSTYAFLVNEDKQSGRFNVISLQLSEQQFETTPAGTPDHQVVKFERADLAEYCKTVLQEHNARIALEENDTWRRFGSQVNEGTEFFVLARACAAQMEQELSQKLLTVAAPLLKRYRDASNPNTTLKQDLSDDLANMTMWGIIVDFGDPKVSHDLLFARLRKFEKNYPTSRHFQRARETSLLVKEMLEEDKTHEQPKDLDALPAKEKVAELIFRLRDQNGLQLSQPGSCNIFFGGDFTGILQEGGKPDDNQKHISPAHHLVEIGYDSVPQLIVALEDQRFTRSVGYHRNFYFSHHVLRVGDCAEQILCRIANRDFYQRTYTNGAMVKDGNESSVKRQVEDWWQDVQSKGEKHVLIEGTVCGDQNSYNQARRLLEKYPDVAMDAIIKGARNANSSWVRQRLTQLAGSVGGSALEFLTEEMKKAPQLESRVTAASELFKLKPDIAVEAMLAEWSAVTRQSVNSGSPSGEVRQGVEDLIQFLAARNSQIAVRAFREKFQVHSAPVKLNIVAAFGTSRSLGYSISGGSLTIPSTFAKADDSVQNEIESLLVSALDDKNRRQGISGSWGGYHFDDPRICDAAAFVLNQRYPVKYKINPNAIGHEADAQLTRAINLWRGENGMELLTEVVPRKIKSLPTEQTAPLIDALLTAKNDRQRTNATNAIRALGPAALRSVLKQTESLAANSERLVVWQQLLRDLSLTTTRITIAEDSVPVPVELKKQIDSFYLKPLSSERIIDLLILIAKDLPEGSTGIQFTAVRNNGETGVEMEFSLTNEWPPENGSQQMWNTSSSIVLDGKSMGNSSGGFGLAYAAERDAYKRFSKTLNKALMSPHDAPLRIRYSLIRDE